MAKGKICPPHNLGKKLKRKHTRRGLVQYRNWKLKQNVESIFYRTFKVHSKVTCQSCSTEHIHLMLNQEWWTHLAIFNISHRKRVRTLESFFAPNRSESESEKNDTEEEECINQEETDEDQRKPKKSPIFQKTWLQDHPWLCYEKDAYVYQKLRMELKFTRGCRNEILLWNVLKYKAWSLILCLNMTRKKKSWHQ